MQRGRTRGKRARAVLSSGALGRLRLGARGGRRLCRRAWALGDHAAPSGAIDACTAALRAVDVCVLVAILHRVLRRRRHDARMATRSQTSRARCPRTRSRGHGVPGGPTLCRLARGGFTEGRFARRRFTGARTPGAGSPSAGSPRAGSLGTGSPKTGSLGAGSPGTDPPADPLSRADRPRPPVHRAAAARDPPRTPACGSPARPA